jgi:hypothetical protein
MENVSGSAPTGERAENLSAEEPAQAESAPRVRARTDARERIIYLLVGALAIGSAFWWLQFSTQSICCGDFDAYYHFKWSRMLWEGMRAGQFPPPFESLPLTTLNPRDYVDHHLLFHIFQIPFTWFSDFRTGAKIGTWLFASLSVFSCFWLVVRYRLRYPLIWLLALLACATPFLYRMNMGKAMSVSIVLLVIGIHLLFQRKYVWLLPLSFIFALTYDMVFLLWAAAGLWFLVVLWSEGFDGTGAGAGERLGGDDAGAGFRALLKSSALWWAAAGLAFVVVGTALGYVINPYFPHNLQLVYEHIVIKVTPKDFSTRVGNEWYPYESWVFLGNCLLAFVAMVFGYVAFNGSDRRGSQRALFFLLFSTFLLIVNARWRRFSEYWPPFAILFAAFALQPVFEGARRHIGRLPSDLLDELQPFLDTHERPDVAARRRRERFWEYGMAAIVAAVISVLLVGNMRVTAKDIETMAGPEYYRGGMEWIRRNVAPRELIFNTDWDDFPKMFFYDSERPVISGLDPTYLLDRDKRLADLYGKIGTGDGMSEEEIKNLGPLIRDNFCYGEGASRRCARIVFTDREHNNFINNALDSGWFDPVYINVFSRKDGRPLSDADLAAIRERAPTENLEWIILDGGRSAVSATARDFTDEQVHALEDTFRVDSDCMIFRMRETQGAPIPDEEEDQQDTDAQGDDADAQDADAQDANANEPDDAP